MNEAEHGTLNRVARQLIDLVGEPPLVAELLEQAEVEEAISILREVAEANGIDLPESLAA